MTDTDLAAVWHAATDELADEIVSAQQRAYLRLTRLRAIVEDTALLSVPDAFTRDVIESRLRPVITEALSRLLGRAIQVAVTVRPPEDAPPAACAVRLALVQRHRRPAGRADRDTRTSPRHPAQPQYQQPPYQQPQYHQPTAVPATPGTSRSRSPNSPARTAGQHGAPTAREGSDRLFDLPTESSWTPPERTGHSGTAFEAARDERLRRPPQQDERLPPRPPSNPGTGRDDRRSAQTPAGDSAGNRLNPKYTFETFVIGSSNRFAHAASVAVAESPAKAYNPLFIYGDSGLGKTHLLHAIGQYATMLGNARFVRYVSTEEFTNDFINSLRDDKTQAFQRRYRDVDILLIDDIQFLETRERTQEEFFHTFNTLHNANKQIVISSDRSPRQLATLSNT